MGAADTMGFAYEIPQLPRDEMHHGSLALDAPAHGEQPRPEQDAPLALVELGPDDDIGDAGLVLERDEKDALGGAGPLAREHEPGYGQDAAIGRVHRVGAGDDAAACQIGAQEGDRVPPQRQARVPIVRGDLGP